MPNASHARVAFSIVKNNRKQWTRCHEDFLHLLVASSLGNSLPAGRRPETQESSAPHVDSRIRTKRCSCRAPCKEQAGNREPSSVPVFYTHRLVLRSHKRSPAFGYPAPPSPALMLRSRASSAFTRVFNALWRGVSKHEGAPTGPVLILRDARTPVRVGGTISHARSSG
jgi:hypothetical protein